MGESRLGNTVQAQNVYSRYIRECMSSSNYNDHFDEKNILQSSTSTTSTTTTTEEIINNENLNNNNEIEVYRISSSRDFVDGEVWMNNGSIEGKIPMSRMKKKTKKKKKNLTQQQQQQQQ